MTTEFVITHVLMLISIVAISWVALDTADANIDLGIRRVPRNFWKNKMKLQLIEFCNLSFNRILLVKNAVNKASEHSKKELIGGFALLMLVLITLIIRDALNPINNSPFSSGGTASYHNERIHLSIK